MVGGVGQLLSMTSIGGIVHGLGENRVPAFAKKARVTVLGLRLLRGIKNEMRLNLLYLQHGGIIYQNEIVRN